MAVSESNISAKTITITLPDGSQRQYPGGTTGMEVARDISGRLAKEALGIRVNGEVRDLMRPIEENARIEILTWSEEEGKKVLWHSSAHLMAEALEATFPGIKFGIGPPIENGFYYDVDPGDRTLTLEDLAAIEQRMKALAKEKNPYERREVSKEEALKYYQQKGDEYKLDLIQDLEDGTITFYQQGQFVDLCRGPHVPHTGYIKAVKLLSIAGAYWRSNENNKQLTRIYGITFPKQAQLEEFLHQREEAKKRDHRKLGRELKLFTFSEKVGGGLPLWMPRGAIVREQLETFLKKEQRRRGYQAVYTPHIGKKDLYVTSGHYAKYGADSFQPIHTPDEKEEYLLKPMNCPHHCEIFNAMPHSYRDLPVRMAEFGTVYRYEQSGELNGLVRVRGFTQDDAHIFCTAEQLKAEFKDVIDLTQTILHKLDFFDYTAQVSLRDPHAPDKYIGEKDVWDLSEQSIREASQEMGLNVKEVEGEAAFYGPKLDFMVKDALGRQWQLGTIQVDYNLPERFELSYIGADNRPHRPVMIHRAPFGSMERFLGVLTEHCAGNFPLWLAPDQVVVLPLNDELTEFAQSVCEKLNNVEIRTFLDNRNEKVGRKIRDAELMKIPYMLIVGEKERASETVSVRRHGQGDQGSMSLKQFVENIAEEIGNL